MGTFTLHCGNVMCLHSSEVGGVSPLGPPTGKSCSVFVSVPRACEVVCANHPRSLGRRKTRVLLLLLLALASRLRPGCIPAASRQRPACVLPASRLRPL